MTRLRALRDPFVDVVAVVLCVASMCVELTRSEKSEPGVLAVVAIVVASLPLLLRRRAPATSFVLAMLAILGIVSTSGIYNTLAIPAVLCGYALADHHGRRAALWAGSGALPAVLLILQVYSPHGLLTWDTAKNLGLVVLPLVLGVSAHDRRRYLAAAVARAETAERTREEETRRRVGEERLRIARDVHDVVAHAMVAINVQAGVGAHLIERDTDQARATLREIKRVSGGALDDLRSMLGVLRDPDDPEQAPVHPTQGLDEISALRDGLGSAGVLVDLDIDPAAASLPASVGATGYRIVQEALTNVLRHAGATSARVRVRRQGDLVVIEVEDDGRAAGPARNPQARLDPLARSGSGNGLRGMRERATAAGGSLEAGPRAEGGWRVRASLPAGVAS